MIYGNISLEVISISRWAWHHAPTPLGSGRRGRRGRRRGRGEGSPAAEPATTPGLKSARGQGNLHPQTIILLTAFMSYPHNIWVVIPAFHLTGQRGQEKQSQERTKRLPGMVTSWFLRHSQGGPDSPLYNTDALTNYF